MGTMPDKMDTDCATAMGIDLHSKMSQQDTIAIDYKGAKILLETITNGFIFPQLLLQQVHPLLAVKMLLLSKFLSTAHLIIYLNT